MASATAIQAWWDEGARTWDVQVPSFGKRRLPGTWKGSAAELRQALRRAFGSEIEGMSIEVQATD